MISHCGFSRMADRRVGTPFASSDEEPTADSRSSRPVPVVAELLRQSRVWNHDPDGSAPRSAALRVPHPLDEVPRTSRDTSSSTGRRAMTRVVEYAQYPSSSLARAAYASQRSENSQSRTQGESRSVLTWGDGSRGSHQYSSSSSGMRWPTTSWQSWQNRLSGGYQAARDDRANRPTVSAGHHVASGQRRHSSLEERGEYYYGYGDGRDTRQTYRSARGSSTPHGTVSSRKLTSVQGHFLHPSARQAVPVDRRSEQHVDYGSSSSRSYRTLAISPLGRFPTAPGKLAAESTSRLYRPKVTPPEDTPAASEKRAAVSHGGGLPPKRLKTGDSPPDESKPSRLDLLCTATLELGPLQENPTGCSCPRSNCIKLYCDCFKAGRRCAEFCSCTNCKNTEATQGERTQAIKNILARNPRAFTGGKKEAIPRGPGDIVCNCVKSRCLKLYCDCFHNGKTCHEACACVQCLNIEVESTDGGRRKLAMQQALEKRPDAFVIKAKAVGSGCACKNNRCLKRYCDCFRFNIACTDKCSCRECGNRKKTIGSTRVVPV